MRSKAKASSAANRDGSGFLATVRSRMSLATRGASFGADGSGAPRAARLAPTAAFAALLGGLVLLFLGTSTPPPADAAVTCPNAEFRTGPSASLPDCRAYELVTPFDANPLAENAHGARASVDGTRFSYFSYQIPPGVESFGNYFLTSRGAGGWSTEGLIPPQSTVNDNICLPTVVFWSPDFSRHLLSNGDYSNAECTFPDPPLVDGAPEGPQNLYVRDAAAGTYELVNVTPDGVEPSDAYPEAVSADLSHVAFDSSAQLTPNAPTGESLFVWSAGVVRLATVLPDGTATQGTIANPVEQGFGGVIGSGANYTGALSEDGSRLFFQAGGNLYLRENPAREQSPLDGGGACADPALACTVQVDASQASGSGGGGDFYWASSYGSLAFFTAPASSGLTSDTVAGSGRNLYRYDADTGALTNLTAAADARVLGVSGISDDGSVVYFVADGALAFGATAGDHNLYRLEAGSTTLVATLSSAFDGTNIAFEFVPVEPCNWTSGCMTARVSPDGRFIAFNSVASLTGYDNVPVDPAACDPNDPRQPSGFPCAQIFIYDAAADSLSCASCNPTGAPPTDHAWFGRPSRLPSTLNQAMPRYLRRNLSGDGEVFFQSPEALVPGDGNSRWDVYEYDDGRLSLLSSGTDSRDSTFRDASASGDDVFVITDQPLVGWDTDTGPSVYDARVGGGLPGPPPAGAPCEGDGCQGLPAVAPAASAAGTAAFQGPGNQLRGQRRSCNSIARRAQKLNRVAQRLRRRAKGAAGAAEARRLRRRAARFANKAEGLSKRAKRCRQTDRRAGK